MKILDNYIIDTKVNDCIITKAITIIQIACDIFIVTYTERSDWENSPITTNCSSYADYNKAVDEYEKLKYYLTI